MKPPNIIFALIYFSFNFDAQQAPYSIHFYFAPISHAAVLCSTLPEIFLGDVFHFSAQNLLQGDC